jgi:hypothetical protein
MKEARMRQARTDYTLLTPIPRPRPRGGDRGAPRR